MPRLRTIEIDDEVYAYLQGKARAFEDSPNAVLRRELLSGRPGRKPQASTFGDAGAGEPSALGSRMPSALAQVLEVMELCRLGSSLNDATVRTGKELGITRQSVQDKYTRQLGLTTPRFTTLLGSKDGRYELQRMLVSRFPRNADSIDRHFTKWAG